VWIAPPFHFFLPNVHSSPLPHLHLSRLILIAAQGPFLVLILLSISIAYTVLGRSHAPRSFPCSYVAPSSLGRWLCPLTASVNITINYVEPTSESIPDAILIDGTNFECDPHRKLTSRLIKAQFVSSHCLSSPNRSQALCACGISCLRKSPA
jgi:hypothetical protein